ncbi:MAG TPA: peptidyl-prolyl cis-trans isomerase [Vicinamibacterales bacterium]|jgi:parvulin-like peptidyl-prolyl isomerase|nr:peptidyl-prolyl cis-trans isomerase [Vicinamibacterales bacterium]
MKMFARGVVAASAALVLVAPLRGAEIIEQVLVKVNGDIITKTELERRQIDALRQRLNANVDPQALRTDEQVQKALAEVTPPLLVNAIDDLLMIQLAREKGFKLPDDAFNRWLTNMRKEQNLVEDQKFEAALKQEGMTMADLRRNVERQFMIQEVQRAEVGSKLQITEAEARQYYQSHQQEFVQPASVTLREILIEAPADAQGARDTDSVKEQADAVRARIAAGEDFAKVAADVSAAPSKANGGLIGPIVVSELSQALQDLLGSMKPGDITQPIRGARGYQIVKLETHTPSVVQPFDSVRDLVAERVYSARQRSEVQKFLSRIRSQAIIIWKNDELKQAYERQIASMQAAPSGNP